MGVALLLHTTSLWLSWSTLDTHGDCLHFEIHQRQHLCLLYLRTPRNLNRFKLNGVNSVVYIREDIECFTDVLTCNSFAGLPDIFDHGNEAHVPDFLSTERVEGRMQQRFELMCRNQQEAMILHRAHGHPNNRALLLNLEAKRVHTNA